MGYFDCVICGKHQPKTCRGRQKYCPGECAIKQRRIWIKQGRVRFVAKHGRDRLAARRREEHLKRFFGFDSKAYADMLAAQGGGCAICGRVNSGQDWFRQLAVDHDHGCCPATHNAPTCGACVRGLLCGPCNKNLGVVEGWYEKNRAVIDAYRTSRRVKIKAA